MCGLCCRNTKWASNLSTRLCWEDIERWKKEKREDILQNVLIFEGLGGDFLTEEGKFFSACPFLKEEAGKCFCSIHETKPLVCKVFPLYFHHDKNCENCGKPITEEDVYCVNCGIFLQVDPLALLSGCPGLDKALKASGFNPFISPKNETRLH